MTASWGDIDNLHFFHIALTCPNVMDISDAMSTRLEPGYDQCWKYGVATKPEALTWVCPGLIIMSGVGFTYTTGALYG